MTLTLTNARIPGERGLMGSLINVVINDGIISDIEFVGATGTINIANVNGDTSEGETIDLGGRYLIPGLWDNHVHFTQWAQSRRRLDVTTANSVADVCQRLQEWITVHPGPVVGFGWRGSLWDIAPTKEALDAVTTDVPVVLISGDFHSAWLNSAALAERGITHDTGLLVEDEAFAVTAGLDNVPQETLDEWVAEAAHAAAARGIVGIVDFEWDWNVASWRRRMGNGLDCLRVEFGIYTEDLDRAIETGLRSGDTIASTDGLLRVGSYKVITDGSLGTRTAFCHEPYPGMSGPGSRGMLNVAFPELVNNMAKADGAGITSAIHAIGDDANSIALNAFEAVGCSGSIEHAQLLSWEDIHRFADMDIIASVQPEHAMDDRETADVLWAQRTDRTYPFATMLAAGVQLAFGSDAPVAPLDPWFAIASAIERTRDDQAAWHPEQRISPEAALAASSRSRVAVGEPADLVVVESDPLFASGPELRAMPVWATFIAGRQTYSAEGND